MYGNSGRPGNADQDVLTAFGKCKGLGDFGRMGFSGSKCVAGHGMVRIDIASRRMVVKVGGRE